MWATRKWRQHGPEQEFLFLRRWASVKPSCFLPTCGEGWSRECHFWKPNQQRAANPKSNNLGPQPIAATPEAVVVPIVSPISFVIDPASSDSCSMRSINHSKADKSYLEDGE